MERRLTLIFGFCLYRRCRLLKRWCDDARKGAGIGALGGAAVGGIIGAAVGRPGAGAAIGGALGLGSAL
jgi:outer membrane lipoprotein SlyB